MLVLVIAGSARGQTLPGDAVIFALNRSSVFDGPNTLAVLALLNQQVTTVPLGTSSGGFAWEFDPALGIVARRSQSYGPIFAERPWTIGRHRLSIGLSTQHTAFRALAGQRLRDGGVYAGSTIESDVFTGSLERVEQRFGLTLDLRTDRTTLNATYGLTSRLDLNVVIPFGYSTVSGSSWRSLTLIDSGQIIDQSEHFFTPSTGGGIADISVKAKYAIVQRRPLAVAIAAELRMPTGSEDKLLGVPTVQQKLSAIGAVAIGRYSPHVEAGYLFAGSGMQFTRDFGAGPIFLGAEPSDEVTFSAGTDAALHRRFTIAADVLARTLKNNAGIVRIVDAGRISFQSAPGDVTLLMGTVGGKLSVGSMWLLTGGILFPLNAPSIKPGVTPMVGFERAF